MGAIASQITSLPIVYSVVHSGADQRKYQSSTSLAFVRGIHRWPVNSQHKGPVTRKLFPFDDVIVWMSNYIPHKTISAITYPCPSKRDPYITATTTLGPYILLFKSLQPLLRLGTCRSHYRVPYFQIRSPDLIAWQHTRIVAPVITTILHVH